MIWAHASARQTERAGCPWRKRRPLETSKRGQNWQENLPKACNKNVNSHTKQRRAFPRILGPEVWPMSGPRRQRTENREPQDQHNNTHTHTKLVLSHPAVDTKHTPTNPAVSSHAAAPNRAAPQFLGVTGEWKAPSAPRSSPPAAGMRQQGNGAREEGRNSRENKRHMKTRWATQSKQQAPRPLHENLRKQR